MKTAILLKTFAVLVFLAGVMVAAYILSGRAYACPDDSALLPTPPPPQPTQIVMGDGTRVDCAPGFTTCDWGSR